jgi:hypothetical protein
VAAELGEADLMAVEVGAGEGGGRLAGDRLPAVGRGQGSLEGAAGEGQEGGETYRAYECRPTIQRFTK